MFNNKHGETIQWEKNGLNNGSKKKKQELHTQKNEFGPSLIKNQKT